MIALVACCATKRDTACPARDLYVSPLFKLSRRYVEQRGLPWMILSAKHGLLDPDTVVEPYNLTLSQMTTPQRRAWAAHVRGQLYRRFGTGQPLCVLAGRLYMAATEGFRVVEPLHGLPIGKRLQALTRMVQTTP